MEKCKKKCSIQEEQNIPKLEQSVLKMYWPFDGEKFKTAPAKVAKHFGLNSRELFEIVKTYSTVYVYDHCKSCGMEMVTNAYCQMDFLEVYYNEGICEKCEEKILNDSKE